MTECSDSYHIARNMMKVLGEVNIQICILKSPGREVSRYLRPFKNDLYFSVYEKITYTNF